MQSQKRAIALDFDGVLHSYDGWNGGRVQGPRPGALAAVESLIERGYEVVIFSTRPASTIDPWLREHGFPPLEVTATKRPFLVIVDDRATCFRGNWDETLKEVLGFKPYWIEARAEKQN